MYDPTKPYTDRILKLIQQTWDTPYWSIDPKTGVEKSKSHLSWPEASSVDGTGTKGKFHWRQRTFHAFVLDALAMNLNDLLLKRAKACRAWSHIMLPEDDHEAIIAIISALVEEAKKRDIALPGGETAIHSNIDGAEIGMMVLGLVQYVQENVFRAGDFIVGIKSNGLHSNGLTLAWDVLGGDGHRPEFTKPTRMYYDEVLPLLDDFDIHGMCHITGGAYSKIKPYLLSGCDVMIWRSHSLEPQDIFHEIQGKGVFDHQMYVTFNCGVGFLLSLDRYQAQDLVKRFEAGDAAIVGMVESHGKGIIRIQSKFSSQTIIL